MMSVFKYFVKTACAALLVAGQSFALEPVETVLHARVMFAYKSDIPDKESFAALEKLTERLQQDFQIQSLSIVGHTDNVGNENSNLTLSVDRADAIREYLDRSVPHIKAPISVKGVADYEPIAENDTEEGRRKNRRVDIEIRGKKTTSTNKRQP